MERFSLRVGENGFLCPHCDREKELVPSQIKPISMDGDTKRFTLDLLATCPEDDGGCGMQLGFLAEAPSYASLKSKGGWNDSDTEIERKL